MNGIYGRYSLRFVVGKLATLDFGVRSCFEEKGRAFTGVLVSSSVDLPETKEK